MLKKIAVSLALLVLLLSGLAGCSAPPAPQTGIDVTFQDGRFMPGAWRIPAGAEITVHFSNTDTLNAHEWTILIGDNALNPAASKKPFSYWSHLIAPGSSETTSFKAPAAAGVYKVGCSLPGHPPEEFLGRLTVVQP